MKMGFAPTHFCNNKEEVMRTEQELIDKGFKKYQINWYFNSPEYGEQTKHFKYVVGVE